MKGKIKFYNPIKGFGFINIGKESYFFHKSKVNCKLDDLKEGVEVSFDEGRNNKGKCAVNIRRV